MSICKTCSRDSKDHTEQLWELHQKKEICILCGRIATSHSKKLWEIHSVTVQKAQRKQKLWSLQIGVSRGVPAVVVGESVWKGQTVKDLKPIYMKCQNCTLYLGDSEVDLADVLGEMCLKCFNDLTTGV